MSNLSQKLFHLMYLANRNRYSCKSLFKTLIVSLADVMRLLENEVSVGLNDKMDVYYTAPLQFGSSKATGNLILDTNSDWLFVTSVSCGNCSIAHSIYDVTKSTTATPSNAV